MFDFLLISFEYIWCLGFLVSCRFCRACISPNNWIPLLMKVFLEMCIKLIRVNISRLQCCYRNGCLTGIIFSLCEHTVFHRDSLNHMVHFVKLLRVIMRFHRHIYIVHNDVNCGHVVREIFHLPPKSFSLPSRLWWVTVSNSIAKRFIHASVMPSFDNINE